MTHSEQLYDALIAKGYTENNIGDRDTFLTKMHDKENRRKLYDFVNKRGDFRIGSYDSYEQRLAADLQPSAQYLNESNFTQPVIPEHFRQQSSQPTIDPDVAQNIARRAELTFQSPEQRTAPEVIADNAQTLANPNSLNASPTASTSEVTTPPLPEGIGEVSPRDGGVNTQPTSATPTGLTGSTDPIHEALSQHLIDTAYSRQWQRDTLNSVSGMREEAKKKIKERAEELRNSGEDFDYSQWQQSPSQYGYAPMTTPGVKAPNLHSDREMNLYRLTIETLDEAQQHMETARKNQSRNGFQQAAAGVGDAIFDIDTLTLGLDSLSKNATLKAILDKADADQPLTQAEESLLNAALYKQFTEAALPNGRWYNVGKGIGEQVPYMLEFALSGGVAGALTKGASKAIGKQVVKYINNLALKNGSKIANRTARNVFTRGSRMLGNTLSQLPGGVMRAAVQVPLRSSVYNDIIERQIGTLGYSPSASGGLKYTGRIDADNTADAITKGLTSGFITNLTESIGGEGIQFITNKIGGLMGKGANAIFKNLQSPRWYNRLRESFRRNGFGEFVKATSWQGPVAEYGEELLDQTLNAIFVGDSSLDPNSENYVFDLDNLIDTAITTGAISLFMGAAGGIASGKIHSDVNKAYALAEKNLHTLHYTDTEINALNNIATSRPQEASKWVSSITRTMRTLAIRSAEIEQSLSPEARTLLSQPSTEAEFDALSPYDQQAVMTLAEINKRFNDLTIQRDYVVAGINYNAFSKGLKESVAPQAEAVMTEIQANALRDSDYTIAVDFRGQKGFLVTGIAEVSQLPNGALHAELPAGSIYQVRTKSPDGQWVIQQAVAEDIVPGTVTPTQQLIDETTARIYAPVENLINTEHAQAQAEVAQAQPSVSAPASDSAIGEVPQGEGVNTQPTSATPSGLNAPIGLNGSPTNEQTTPTTEELTISPSASESEIGGVVEDRGGSIDGGVNTQPTSATPSGLNAPNGSTDLNTSPTSEVTTPPLPEGIGEVSPRDGGVNTQPTEGATEQAQSTKQISNEERMDMQNRILDWLSEKNLSKAIGKSRDEIFEEFGNELLPIAYVPSQYTNLVDPNIIDTRIYCGKGYFIDHALRNHAEDKKQTSITDIDVSKYLNIQNVLDNPDSIKETFVDGKRTVIFIKKIGRYFAELTQVEENGKIVLHKSFFNQKKEPYAKLTDIRQKNTSSEGGTSSISHTDNSVPAISLQSRGDVMSNDNLHSVSTDKDTTSSLNNNNLDENVLSAEEKNTTTQAKLAHINAWQQAIDVPIVIFHDISEVDNPQAVANIQAGNTTPGWFANGTVYIYLPHAKDERDIDATIMHECIAHFGIPRLFATQEQANAFYNEVWNTMPEADQYRFLRYPGVSHLKGEEARRAAADEYIAHLAEQIRTKRAGEAEVSLWQRIVAFFRNALRRANVNLRLNDTDLTQLLLQSLDALKKNNEQPQDTTSDNALDANEVVVTLPSNGTETRFSIRSFREEGRATVTKWLDRRVKSRQITKQEAQDILDQLDTIYDICQEYTTQYAPFGDWSEAQVNVDVNGNPVLSVIKSNGEYAMNLDFSLVCKKRRTLDAVFQEMIARDIINDFELDGVQVAKVNEIIRSYGFETACRLCFVDAKRFRIAAVADAFVNLFNELSTMSDRKLRQVIKAEPTTVRGEAAQLLLNDPSQRIKVSRSDFMSAEGFERIKRDYPEIMKLYNAKKGTGGPKASFGDVQYLNEIEKRHQWTPNKAYAVGGVRLQSFSDYVPRMVFDYVQMIADLAAKRLPVHAYTKEAIFAKQFGLTGIKINLSLVPRVDPDGIAPGLDRDGNYVWQESETFPYDEAIAIQNAEGYRDNCGTIAVGVSDAHILKMLDDENIRMVIPYHKSVLNPAVAIFNNIDAFVDYTNEQNTRYANGTKLSKDEKQFNFNEALRKAKGNPRIAAQQYLDWCRDNNYLPKFDKFASHPNYYKLLEDFTTMYTQDGVDTIVPQHAVEMRFPTEQDAFGSMRDLIAEGLEADAILEGQRNEQLSAIVDEIAATLPTKTKAKTETKTIRFRSKKKTAPETVSVPDEHHQTVVSSADGAKILKNIDDAIKQYANDSITKEKTFIGNLAKILGAKKHGSNSQYATFEAVNGKVFTIRLANHNTKVSTFDNHNESEGISIVISPATNTRAINDGDAHIVEYFYNAIKLRKADGKPLVEILKSIKQSLYSGEYTDTTGLAEREEVNKPTSFRSITPDESLTDYARSVANGQQTTTPTGLNAPVALASANDKNKLPGTPIRFRMTRRTESTVNGWINRRTDLTPDEREAVIQHIDNLDGTALQLATAKWFAQGTIRIPEDNIQVEQAIKVAARAKVDPLAYDYPQAIISAFPEAAPKQTPINPDDVPTLHDKQELPNGLTVYTVDESRESQQAVRDIINTHLGNHANPWCVTSAIDNQLTDESWEYWQSYTSHPKRIAFHNGKVVAFFASDNGWRIWWDTQDRPHFGIPFSANITDGEYNEENNTIDTYNIDGNLVESIPATSFRSINPDESLTDYARAVVANGQQTTTPTGLNALNGSAITPDTRFRSIAADNRTADYALDTIEQATADYADSLNAEREAIIDAITPTPNDSPRTIAEKTRLRSIGGELVTRDNTELEDFLALANKISNAMAENDARHKHTAIAESQYDSMQRLHNLIDDLRKQGALIDERFDPWLTQNQSRSRAQATTKVFDLTYRPTLYDAIARGIRVLFPGINTKDKAENAKGYSHLSLYAQARTAIERQEIKSAQARAEAEEKGEEYKERDFGGLAGIQEAIFGLYSAIDDEVENAKGNREKLTELAIKRGIPTVKEFVDNAEAKLGDPDTNGTAAHQLWTAIRSISQYKLATSYLADITSRAGYQTLTYGRNIDALLREKYDMQVKQIKDHPDSYDNVTDYDKDGIATDTRKVLNDNARIALAKLNKEYIDAINAVPMPSMRGDSISSTGSWQHLIDTGWLTEEDVNDLHSYYMYYMPLKGHAELTAEDINQYQQKTPRNQSKIKAVKGHRHLAKDPFNQLILDTHGVIQSAEQNRWRLNLYNILTNNPNSSQYIVEQRFYKVKTKPDGSKEYVPYGTVETINGVQVFIPGHPTAEELANGSALAYNNRNTRADVDIHISSDQRKEHSVTVLVGGEAYTMFFYDKRIADAINGTNIKRPSDWWKQLDKLQALNRLYAGLKTSLNPTFTLISNLPRDWMEMVSNNFIEHGLAHAVTSFIYRVRATRAGDVQKAIRKHQEGKLLTMADATTDVERYVVEFFNNGGSVNITQLPDYNTAKVELMDDLNTYMQTGEMPKGGRLSRSFNNMAERVELAPRIATYIASRKLGHNISQSINDAKEATVNFDRKGSWSGIMGMFQLFYNAAAQSVRRQIGLARRHPVRFAVAYATIGFLSPLNNIMMSYIMSILLGDDDNLEDIVRNYFAINPELRRRYNIILIGNDYIRIPMAVNYLPYVTLGDVIANWRLNPNYRPNVLKDTLDIAAAILDTFTPSMFAQPIGFAFDAITAKNNEESANAWRSFAGSIGNTALGFFFGRPIEPLMQALGNYNFMGSTLFDMPYDQNSQEPAYLRARQYTQPVWVWASHLLNDITGGNDVHAGWLNIAPEQIENVMTVFGGYGEYGENVASLIKGGIEHIPQIINEVITAYANKEGALPLITETLRILYGHTIGEDDFKKSIPMLSRLYGGNVTERADKSLQSMFYDDTTALAQYTEYRNNATTASTRADFDRTYSPDEQRYFADLATMESIAKKIRTEIKAATPEGEAPKYHEDERLKAIYNLANEQFHSLATGEYKPIDDPYYTYMYIKDAIEKTPYRTADGSYRLLDLSGYTRNKPKDDATHIDVKENVSKENDKAIDDLVSKFRRATRMLNRLPSGYYPGIELDKSQSKDYDRFQKELNAAKKSFDAINLNNLFTNEE